ncbi:MAG TPA: hypothetical protein VFE65_15835 [Pseudonocardia sp.]|nr:hypothetical protein [Pseudonocardia sp.]
MRPPATFLEATLPPSLRARITARANDGTAALPTATNATAITTAGATTAVSLDSSPLTAGGDVSGDVTLVFHAVVIGVVVIGVVVIGAGPGSVGASTTKDPTSSVTAIHNPTESNPPHTCRVRHLPSLDRASTKLTPLRRTHNQQQ